MWPSGNTYTGAWVQDQRQGLGSMHWKTRGQHYTGHWVQGLPDGFGEHIWEQQRPAAGVPGSNHAMHVMHNRCGSQQHCVQLCMCAGRQGWLATC